MLRKAPTGTLPRKGGGSLQLPIAARSTRNWSSTGCPSARRWDGYCAATGTMEKRPWLWRARNTTCNCDAAHTLAILGLTNLPHDLKR